MQGRLESDVLAERVAEYIRRYCMFEPGQRAGVAVSGGADSVCLLHVLAELAPRWALHLCVLHLNHKLRGAESDGDARFVQNLARSFGLDVHTSDACLENEGNLEQAARNARREFFLACMSEHGLDRVALGHTRSDQAETVLFRFLRGSGTAGLAGIRPVTTQGFVRPLLATERFDVEQYLRDRNIAWRNDSSNSATAFARNRIRHEVLPFLTRNWNPALTTTLAHMADWALEEEQYWSVEIERLARAHLERRGPAMYLKGGPLTGLPVATARRLLRRAVETIKGDLRGIEFEHISQIQTLASATEGHSRLQIPGVDVFRSFDWLRFAPPGLDRLENRNFRFPLSVPGAIAVPGQAAEFNLELIDTEEAINSGYNDEVSRLDWERISGPLELRNWRPGDQYKAIGHSGEEKIKLLFQEARIPLWERRHWPVITGGGSIIWARRFGPAADCAASAGCRRVLEIRVTQSRESNERS